MFSGTEVESHGVGPTMKEGLGASQMVSTTCTRAVPGTRCTVWPGRQ